MNQFRVVYHKDKTLHLHETEATDIFEACQFAARLTRLRDAALWSVEIIPPPRKP